MATVFIPTMLQGLTTGVKQVEIEGSNLRRLIDRLEELYPGIKASLVEDGGIRPNLAVAIDGEVARMGLLEKVGENSEVHFVPAIGGGAFSDYRKTALFGLLCASAGSERREQKIPTRSW